MHVIPSEVEGSALSKLAQIPPLERVLSVGMTK
jgi:hypothetical protein